MKKDACLYFLLCWIGFASTTRLYWSSFDPKDLLALKKGTNNSCGQTKKEAESKKCGGYILKGYCKFSKLIRRSIFIFIEPALWLNHLFSKVKEVLSNRLLF